MTIGAYDGVHRGHQRLMAELRRRAEQDALVPTVVTFDRHPATVVRPESAPLLLTDLEQKLELLAACGVARTLVLTFDAARAEEPAEDFVEEILLRALGTRLVVVGEDFHFGHGRKGNVALLRSMGAERGFVVDGVTLEEDGTEAISSTRIRRLVGAGQVEAAADLLGRAYQLRGVVERGDARGGAELGFPTANVAVPGEVLLPAAGIYACWYERADGTRHPAAVSVGLRPTFYDRADRLLVEAFLLDFSGDLYGEPARVSFVARLRDEERFESSDALVAQIGRDVERTREILLRG